MNKFIQELSRIQKERGWADGDMAEKIGCTRQWYWAVKRGRAKPSVQFMNQVVKAFPTMSKCVRDVIDAMFK